MTDYTSRADELLRQIDGIQSVIPEEATRRLRAAVGDYMNARRDCLDDLLDVVRDDSSGNRENARRWSDRCGAMISSIPGFLENTLNNIVLDAQGTASGLGWVQQTMRDERTFFERLAAVNAAQMRDYLVANLAGLTEYTQALDRKWEAIRSGSGELHAKEREEYARVAEMVQKMAEEVTAAEKTALEKSAVAASTVADMAEKSADVIVKPVEAIIEFVTGVKVELPDVVGGMIEAVAGTLKVQTDLWIETNGRVNGRLANYRSLLQSERGGLLPIFRETRREVSEYWDKNGTERARDWLARSRSSLDEWLSACPTSAQREDAKRFYEEAYRAVEAHLGRVEAVGREFESKWNGLFKGPLAQTTVDELVEEQPWRMNAETLANLGTPSLVDALLTHVDAYYESSFSPSLRDLRSRLEQLPEPQRADALRAVDLVERKVQDTIRDRVVRMRSEVASSFAWFGSVRDTLDRSALKGELN